MNTKYFFYLLIVVNLIFTQSHAQTYKKKTNEIGLFLETFGYFSANGGGVIYKKYHKVNTARRFQIAYNNTEIREASYFYSLIMDTLTENYIHETKNKFSIGYGIEKQTHFYKNVFLYAAIDARLGYSKSNYWDAISKKLVNQINGINYTYGDRTYVQLPNYKSNGLIADFIPSIGGKINSRNVVVGIESGIKISTGFIKSSTPKDNTIFDFDMDLMAMKLYAVYKF